MAFRIASSPYTHNRRSTGNIMLLVVLAAVPGFAAQCYFFGYGTFLQVLLATLTAWLTEAAILRLRKAPVASTLADNSALLTAVLIGISLPPLAPWWLVVIGTLFAVVIAKQLYGGLGQNPFNPAMVGYVVLLISFPVQMTSWLPPDTLQAIKPGLMDSLSMVFQGHTLAGETMQQLQMGVDGISQATPLDTFKTGLRAGTVLNICWRSRFTAACWRASAGSGLTWVIWPAACSCFGKMLSAGMSLPPCCCHWPSARRWAGSSHQNR